MHYINGIASKAEKEEPKYWPVIDRLEKYCLREFGSSEKQWGS